MTGVIRGEAYIPSAMRVICESKQQKKRRSLITARRSNVVHSSIMLQPWISLDFISKWLGSRGGP